MRKRDGIRFTKPFLCADLFTISIIFIIIFAFQFPEQATDSKKIKLQNIYGF